MPGVAHDLRWLGLFGLAHPNPDEFITLLDREAAHLGLRGNFRLSGNVDAAPGAIKEHAVIFAADVVAEHLALRQRHTAVTTAVFQRSDAIVGAPIHDDGLVEDSAGKRLAGDLIRPA